MKPPENTPRAQGYTNIVGCHVGLEKLLGLKPEASARQLGDQRQLRFSALGSLYDWHLLALCWYLTGMQQATPITQAWLQLLAPCLKFHFALAVSFARGCKHPRAADATTTTNTTTITCSFPAAAAKPPSTHPFQTTNTSSQTRPVHQLKKRLPSALLKAAPTAPPLPDDPIMKQTKTTSNVGNTPHS